MTSTRIRPITQYLHALCVERDTKGRAEVPRSAAWASPAAQASPRAETSPRAERSREGKDSAAEGEAGRSGIVGVFCALIRPFLRHGETGTINEHERRMLETLEPRPPPSPSSGKAARARPDRRQGP